MQNLSARQTGALLVLLGYIDDEAVAEAQMKERIREIVDRALAKLALDQKEEVRREVAANPSSSPAALERLAGDQYWQVRSRARNNPGLPPAYLTALRRVGASPNLRRYWQPDPTLPLPTLSLLARGGPFARLLVAWHPKTTPELLTTLCHDEESWAVRRAALRHPATPAAFKEKFSMFFTGSPRRWQALIRGKRRTG